MHSTRSAGNVGNRVYCALLYAIVVAQDFSTYNMQKASNAPKCVVLSTENGS